MKTLLLILFLATTANAATVDKLGFMPYSSATSVSCGVFATPNSLSKEAGVGSRIQGPNYDPTYSRTLLLGTKTMKNYSTNIGGSYRAAVTATCTETGTNTAVSVKMMLNEISTHFLTLDSHTFVIGY